MKKRLLFFLFLAFLLACNNNTGTDYANKATDSEIQIEINDGKQYGCDVVCWFDGFGLCYRLGDEEEATYKIRLSDRVTIAETYSKDEKIYRPRDSSGYCIYLTSETVSYRIGFLRILDEPHIWGYDTFFELLTVEDPQAQILPVEPKNECIWTEKNQGDGAYFSKVNEDGSVLMHPIRFEVVDGRFEEVDQARGEPLQISITDETLTMICLFDSQRPDMLVTRERMLQLVRDGYFMEYPCWVKVSDGKLLTAMQINNF